ncbi:hypothetical protein [Ferviditalea candida]|uniref:Uncharacterized protein n=1 Tax=Ferviditalea candida TaxID=3108399 RepID=A0ABU5ZM11_9BACL|nr:hypothetical protein [Paenibacillaceae bacterium T2]
MATKSLRKALAIIVSVILVTLFVSACGSSGTPSASSTPGGSTAQSPGSSQSPSQSVNPNQAKGQPADNKILSIATLPIGTSFNAVGNGLAKVISNKSSIRVSVKPYAGQTAWGPLLDSGQIDLGVSEYPEVSWGLKGEEGFTPHEKFAHDCTRQQYHHTRICCKKRFRHQKSR